MVPLNNDYAMRRWHPARAEFYRAESTDFAARQGIIRTVGTFPFGRPIRTTETAHERVVSQFHSEGQHYFSNTTGGAAIELSGPAVDDLTKFLKIDDEASPVSRYDIFPIEFIQIFRDLLTRGADEAGQRLVTDSQSDQDSTRVG